MERDVEARRDIERAASGDAVAIRRLVTSLAPVVRVAVARVLYRYRGKMQRRDVAQETEDIAQEVFAALFEEQARVLRSWEPTRGASLEGFVRIVAERTALSILRSNRRSPFTEEPVEEMTLELALGEDVALDEQLVSRDLLERLHDRLKETLTPRGYLLFRRLYIESADVELVCTELAMAKDAVYAWKHRFGKSLQVALDELVPPSSSKLRAATSEKGAGA